MKTKKQIKNHKANILGQLKQEQKDKIHINGTIMNSAAKLKKFKFQFILIKQLSNCAFAIKRVSQLRLTQQANSQSLAVTKALINTYEVSKEVLKIKF